MYYLGSCLSSSIPGSLLEIPYPRSCFFYEGFSDLGLVLIVLIYIYIYIYRLFERLPIGIMVVQGNYTVYKEYHISGHRGIL